MKKALIIAIATIATLNATQSFARPFFKWWPSHHHPFPQSNPQHSVPTPPGLHTCWNIVGKPYQTTRPCGIS